MRVMTVMNAMVIAITSECRRPAKCICVVLCSFTNHIYILSGLLFADVVDFTTERV